MAELVFSARPHPYIHRVWMNNCTFIQKNKTYKIISGGFDHRGDVIKFMDMESKQEYVVTEADFFSKVDKRDLKHPQ